MKNLNLNIKKLSLITFSLFILSLITYFWEHHRSSELFSGSDLIRGLDPDKVAKIVIKREGSEYMIIKKEGDQFLLEKQQNFPASVSKINDLFYLLSNISIEEKLGSSPSLHDKYKTKEGVAITEVILYSTNGNPLLHLLAGENKGKGSVVRLANSKDVYLTEKHLFINMDKFSYMDNSIIKLKSEEIASITGNSGSSNEFTLLRQGALFNLKDVPPEKSDQSKINAFIATFNSINLTDFTAINAAPATAPFNQKILVVDNSQTSYEFSLAMDGDKHYLKLNAVGAPDGNQKAALLNSLWSKWIYTISKEQYDQLIKSKDLLSKG
ncbi:MAG: DUF4340 domain-containing protein [Oligoflexia bacterium]|nr:DUF4340 domain-containing protein [Oligoflexia bacterium]